MTISEAMDNLVNEVRAIGLGEYFDGLDYDDIIENALDAYRRDIIARADEIMEDMYPEGIDSESVEQDELSDTYLGEDEYRFDGDWCGWCDRSVTTIIAADGHRVCPYCAEQL